MPLWTLGNCMSFATAALGNRSDIAVSTASHWANVAHIALTNALEPQGLEGLAVSSTTSGENRITLPTDFMAAINLSNISSTPPSILDPDQAFDFDSALTTFAAPLKYALYGNSMELWPTPDSSYSLQLRYQVRPSVLTNATASPSFDTRWGMAWCYETTALLANSIKEWDTGTFHHGKYLQEMVSVPSDKALRQRDRAGMRISIPRNNQMFGTSDFTT